MPLLTPDTFETYSQEQFEKVKQLRAQGRGHDTATAVLWLKGFFSPVLYTEDMGVPEELRHGFVTTTTLERYASGAHEVLRKLRLELHAEAPNSGSPYTLGILSHFNKILQDAKRGIEHGDLEAKYSSTIKNIKFNDMGGERAEELRALGSQTFDLFRSDMVKLARATPESNMIDIISLTKLVELRKACILIIAGGDCIPRALPYLANTYYNTVAIWSPQVGLFLLYAYQHVLSPALFEQTIQFIWLFLHNEKSEEWTAGLSLPNPRMHEKEQSATLQDQRET
ncbi:hypothetical protein DL96DRAFT_203099 [Flagelloscypha sp. PMI_526]|nr:hypothetical protein DL96DRAFT_203099 [Flagelloscypha sp. PMI_526]